MCFGLLACGLDRGDARSLFGMYTDCRDSNHPGTLPVSLSLPRTPCLSRALSSAVETVLPYSQQFVYGTLFAKLIFPPSKWSERGRQRGGERKRERERESECENVAERWAVQYLEGSGDRRSKALSVLLSG